MQDTAVPVREELVRRAGELVPLLRERSRWIDENRRLPDDVLAGMEAAGLLRMRVPQQYGGFESDARTLVDVHAEIARGDGSAAFCLSVWSLINWIVGRFPDEVQDEVFATPDVRVCGSISATGTATPVDGGYLYNGRWRFSTGVLHSHYAFSAAMLDGPPEHAVPMTALIPVSDLKIVDDWYVTGLRGTGSVTTSATDVFVPAARVVAQSDLFSPQSRSVRNTGKGIYEIPLLVTSTAATAGQTIGAAKYAMETFLDRLPGRPITYTAWTSQRDAPITHLKVGEAALLTEEAEMRAHAFAALIDAKAQAGTPWSEQERVYSRVQLGRIAQLAKQAVHLLASASGASSIYENVPIQRIQRNLDAMAMHALTFPETNIELYGRVLCGLAPNTPYL
ncbi:acyl-CoA dehydrogenase family protein [Catenuloplanes sp. NPDC051500]|uniref:acyl-CoA dehydrogenase family protein n=1 Tax=Catenuloplanes sp. NPDC051500 TaxID=3363959 RepID=UPI00379AC323